MTRVHYDLSAAEAQQRAMQADAYREALLKAPTADDKTFVHLQQQLGEMHVIASPWHMRAMMGDIDPRIVRAALVGTLTNIIYSYSLNVGDDAVDEQAQVVADIASRLMKANAGNWSDSAHRDVMVRGVEGGTA